MCFAHDGEIEGGEMGGVTNTTLPWYSLLNRSPPCAHGAAEAAAHAQRERAAAEREAKEREAKERKERERREKVVPPPSPPLSPSLIERERVVGAPTRETESRGREATSSTHPPSCPPAFSAQLHIRDDEHGQTTTGAMHHRLTVTLHTYTHARLFSHR